MGDKLGIYIHIPFCRSKCDYCDFYSLSGREGRMDHYQKALLAHLRETAPLTQGIPVDSVYFGGSKRREADAAPAAYDARPVAVQPTEADMERLDALVSAYDNVTYADDTDGGDLPY